MAVATARHFDSAKPIRSSHSRRRRALVFGIKSEKIIVNNREGEGGGFWHDVSRSRIKTARNYLSSLHSVRSYLK